MYPARPWGGMVSPPPPLLSGFSVSPLYGHFSIISLLKFYL